MTITDYQAKYLAYELTCRRPTDSDDRLTRAVADAQVELNPHQVEAALFAFQSPLSKGALLADEVGLGKTIEAGLVISQRWAESKRKILVITPANLRKQWYQELTEKFFLPCVIIEAKSYNAAIRAGQFQPLEPKNAVTICSYQFARSKAAEVNRAQWDLVVMDEAHRLRNVYKPSNVIANTLKQALAPYHKLLLTATPLQNSLLELFGLVSFIDDHTFGDLKSFRDQFSNLSQEQVFQTLKQRLRPLCFRTLRRQVVQYVSYTKRLPILEEFTPDESEDQLYDLVTEYLRRPNLQALPAGQRTLMTLVLRKLLASSSFAIAGALKSIAERLKKRLITVDPNARFDEQIAEDYEALESTAEEWEEDEEKAPLSPAEAGALSAEIADLEAFASIATSIDHNAKGRALLKALDTAFRMAASLGADRKAIIFTESRKTQDYLLRLLADSPYRDGLVLFNGSNTDERSKVIYRDWVEHHQGSDRITGSRTADMRSALVDYFREEGQIMIATEAGAEGINLQFCSLVVNYDLPWNPQRIEQRIGRCHRYGQKHDVVVVNFVNRKNEADKRVFELLSQKFELFEGVFGASDEVLGAIGSGVDFEKRIADIYQRCRKPDEIKAAFDQLQGELSLEIDEAMTATKRKLLENFDDEVREKLKIRSDASRANLDRFERMLMRLTRHELKGLAEFHDDSTFVLHQAPPGCDAKPGRYELPRRTGEAHLYRLGHPLAELVVNQAKTRDLPIAQVDLSYDEREGKVTALKPLVGQAGWLTAAVFTVESLDQAEDHLIVAAVNDLGQAIDHDVAWRLLGLKGRSGPITEVQERHERLGRVELLTQERRAVVERVIADRNTSFFVAESEKLDGWADDQKLSLEREIKDLERQIKETRKASVGKSLEQKVESLKQVKALEAQRNQKRRSLFDAQDEVDRQRGELIARIEAKLEQHATLKPLFTVRWRLT